MIKQLSAHARAAKKYREAHVKKGLCPSCPRPATHGKFCKVHHKKYTEWRIRRYKPKRRYKKKPFGKMV